MVTLLLLKGEEPQSIKVVLHHSASAANALELCRAHGLRDLCRLLCSLCLVIPFDHRSPLGSVHINCEFDRINSSLCAQVVHTCFESLLPSMEMHGRELCRGSIYHVDVERLGLVNVCATICSHVKHCTLLDFPNRLVQLLQII